MEHSFAEVLRAAPFIRFERSRTTWVWEPGVSDTLYERRPYSEHCTEGDGSEANPYQYRYRSAVPVSPHYAVVDLWYRFHPENEEEEVYIRVDNKTLTINREGVIVPEGTFTKLRLEQYDVVVRAREFKITVMVPKKEMRKFGDHISKQLGYIKPEIQFRAVVLDDGRDMALVSITVPEEAEPVIDRVISDFCKHNGLFFQDFPD